MSAFPLSSSIKHSAEDGSSSESRASWKSSSSEGACNKRTVTALFPTLCLHSSGASGLHADLVLFQLRKKAHSRRRLCQTGRLGSAGRGARRGNGGSGGHDRLEEDRERGDVVIVGHLEDGIGDGRD